MKVYAEFKRCLRTHYCYGYDFDFYANVAYMPMSGNCCFIDGKDRSGHFFITPDLKFVYCLCYGTPFFYKVTNVSAKPIQRKVDKVKEWHRVTKEINKLKERRRKLMQ